MARRALWLTFIVVAIVVASAPTDKRGRSPSPEQSGGGQSEYGPKRAATSDAYEALYRRDEEAEARQLKEFEALEKLFQAAEDQATAMALQEEPPVDKVPDTITELKMEMDNLVAKYMLKCRTKPRKESLRKEAMGKEAMRKKSIKCDKLKGEMESVNRRLVEETNKYKVAKIMLELAKGNNY